MVLLLEDEPSDPVRGSGRTRSACSAVSQARPRQPSGRAKPRRSECAVMDRTRLVRGSFSSRTVSGDWAKHEISVPPDSRCTQYVSGLLARASAMAVPASGVQRTRMVHGV
ncbi:hypothetical protein [Nonomuraea sp. NPDC003709]|uniref:hypothetical protein n=1 Tax=Nonomuraea sp. NPDC003709 TaxID=3154450 RepID=UPI0033BA8E59